MLGTVYSALEDAKERVRQIPGQCSIAEATMDDDHGDDAEGKAPAPGANALERVSWPYHPVVVLIPVGSMLLQYLGSGMLISMLSAYTEGFRTV